MIKSNYVADFLRDNNATFWKLRYMNEKGNMLTSYPNENEAPTIDGSLTYFEKILTRLLPGRYFIEAWQTEGQKKEWCKTFFNVDNATGNIDQSVQQYFAGIGSVPGESIDEKINKALNDYKKDQEITTLKSEVTLYKNRIKELELEINSSQNKIMKRISPYLPELMEGMGFSKVDGEISGSGEIDIDSEALSKNLKDWYDEDNDMPEMVEKILKLAKTNISTYQMAKNVLTSQ